MKQAWQILATHQETLRNTSIRDLFAKHKNRFEDFSVELGDMVFDYSKQCITEETRQKLCALAEASQLSEKRSALFLGEKLNFTEHRSVLHTALRSFSTEPLMVDGQDLKAVIQSALIRLAKFSEDLRTGSVRGATGLRFTELLCLGIGGSDLGPLLVTEALEPYKTSDIRCHFVSNVDGKTLSKVLAQLDPHRTLCLITSKTFTTPETLLNAKAVKTWLMDALGVEDAVRKHLLGITANPLKAEAWGIERERIFEFWEFVGGRYSIWSPVGLPVAIVLGMEQFRAFLEGASEVDRHFAEADFAANIPVLMALLEIWNINFWGRSTQAIIPYDDGLRLLPAYLQQLVMESNGKSVNSKGEQVNHQTAAVIWGGVGCNSQHAYMQLLHQGTQIIPVDFFIAAKGEPEFQEQHNLLVASCLTQSKALMEGSLDPEPNPHKACFGNRPSNTFLYSKLTPKILGKILALYEHKVFVQGLIWQINSFDQFGVELGKKITQTLLQDLEKPLVELKTDSSTLGLIKHWQKKRQ